MAASMCAQPSLRDGDINDVAVHKEHTQIVHIHTYRMRASVSCKTQVNDTLYDW